MSRNRLIWGDDANVFRPERWLDSLAEKIKEMEAMFELIFGYGKWQCLRRNIVMIELNKGFVELLRNFDLTVIDPMKPLNSINVRIFMQSEMWLRASERG